MLEWQERIALLNFSKQLLESQPIPTPSGPVASTPVQVTSQVTQCGSFLPTFFVIPLHTKSLVIFVYIFLTDNITVKYLQFLALIFKVISHLSEAAK